MPDSKPTRAMRKVARRLPRPRSEMLVALQHRRACGTDLQPRMTDAESAVYRALLDKSSGVLEYGTGGSTLLAARGGIRCLSVESDRAWIRYLRWLPDIRQAEQAGMLRFFVPDLGPVAEWGYPTDPARRPYHPVYSLGPFAPDAPWQPDLVLVDGRFRVACALAALWYLGGGATVAVHDFWDREQYHGLLGHVEVVERVDTLGVFTVSPHLDRAQLGHDLFAALYDPR